MQNSKGLFSAISALILIVFVSLGCSSLSRYVKDIAEKQNQEQEGRTKKDDNGITKSAGSESPSESLVKKSNLYISKCFNTYSTSIANSHQRYTSWIKDPKAGPTGKESIVYGLYQINGNGDDCVEAIASAKVQEPSMPEIEAAADKFVASLKEVVPKIADVYDYYDKENYKDDGFAKGKAAHPALIEAFDNFEAVNKEFAVEIDKLEDNVAQMQLEEFKDDPSKTYQYAAVDFSIKAKKILTYIRDKQYTEMKADDLQPLIEDAETSLTTVKGSSAAPMSTAFSGQADQFIKAAKELMRRIRDKKAFNNFERGLLGRNGGWMVEGSPDKVVNTYNQMIRMRSFDNL